MTAGTRGSFLWESDPTKVAREPMDGPVPTHAHTDSPNGDAGQASNPSIPEAEAGGSLRVTRQSDLPS